MAVALFITGAAALGAYSFTTKQRPFELIEAYIPVGLLQSRFSEEPVKKESPVGQQFMEVQKAYAMLPTPGVDNYDHRFVYSWRAMRQQEPKAMRTYLPLGETQPEPSNSLYYDLARRNDDRAVRWRNLVDDYVPPAIPMRDDVIRPNRLYNF